MQLAIPQLAFARSRMAYCQQRRLAVMEPGEQEAAG